MLKRIARVWVNQWIHPIQTAKAEPGIFWSLQAAGVAMAGVSAYLQYRDFQRRATLVESCASNPFVDSVVNSAFGHPIDHVAERAAELVKANEAIDRLHAIAGDLAGCVMKDTNGL